MIIRKIHRLDSSIAEWIGLTRFSEVLMRNRGWLAYLAILSIIAYGADLFTFSLTIDDENHAQSPGAKLAWASQSRWGMYVLNWMLLPDPVTAFISPALAVFATAFGIGLIVRLLDVSNTGFPSWLAAAVGLACPSLFYCFAFTTLGYGVGVGFLVLAVGFYVFVCLSGWRRLLCFPLLGFATAIYQPFLLVMAAFFAAYLLSRILSAQSFSFGMSALIKEVFLFAVVLLMSWGFYYGIQQAFFRWGGVVPSDYLEGFMDFSWSSDYLRPVIVRTLEEAGQYYFGGIKNYAYDLFALRWLVLVSVPVVAIRILFSEVAWQVKILGMLCFLVMLAIPFLMNIMNSGFMPGRALLAFPVVLAALVCFGAGSSFRLMQLLLAILAVMTFWSFAVTNNRFAFSNHMAWQADRELTTLILERIYDLDLPEKTPHQQWPLELVGNFDYPETAIFVRRNTIGSSFYGWANGDVRRTAAFLRTMGVRDFRPVTDEERRLLPARVMQMPAWPRSGSVALLDGVIVIKLGQYTQQQVSRVCAGAAESDPVCQQLRKPGR
ncbi:MAG: hypothetical protein EP312_00540 [Gammaproteobacteria bacterium]|nr:MAG: hypothetical protein EP312_00540 [Gammaproteobacteria bacterium]